MAIEEAITVVTRKIGQNRGRPRLWLEGKVLIEAGFQPGDHYTVDNDLNCDMMLLKKSDGERKVSGKGEKPIMDILGRTLEQFFGADNIPTTVSIHVFDGVLLVERNDV